MHLHSDPRLSPRINSLVTLLLIILLSVLLGWLSTRYSSQFDLTRSGRHSLSETSMQVLARMKGPVDITTYARDDAAIRTAIKQFIQRYQRAKPDINLHFINPDIVPDEVRAQGIQNINEMVIRYQGKTEHLQPGSEEAMTNALQRLSRESSHWLVFLEGHGERSALGEANFDLGHWSQQLINRGFKIQPVNLANIQAMPDNTRVLVIAGPQVALLTGEMEIIKNYLETGGNLLWLLDPGTDAARLPGLTEQLGIEVPEGTIIDVAGQLIGLDDPTIVLATERLYPPHPATSGFTFTTFFPKTTSIKTSHVQGWQVTPLLSTGDHVWQETGSLETEVEYNEAVDLLGPLDFAVSLEREIETETGQGIERKTQRVVVIGDGDFLSNTYVANSGNMELGMRIMNWLSHDDDYINIPVNIAADTQLDLSPLAAGIIGFGFLLILPLGLFITGIGIWWQRRKQ